LTRIREMTFRGRDLSRGVAEALLVGTVAVATKGWNVCLLGWLCLGVFGQTS